MKKSLLALAVAALATSASAATVYDKDGTSMDIYGRVQSVIYSTHTGEAAGNGDSSMTTSGRLGLNLRQQVTPGFAVFGHTEWEMADAKRDAKGDGFDTRYMWVGADFGQFGSVKAGRFEDAVKYVVSVTDVYDDWGCVDQLDNDDKRDSMFGYSWSGYGFDVNVTAQMAADDQKVDGAYNVNGNNANSSQVVDINDGYALSVGYTTPAVLFGPVGVRLGYGHVDFQTDSNYKDYIDSYDQFAGALTWGTTSQGLYLAALYNIRTFDGNATVGDYDVTGIGASVGYSFANGLTVRTGYNYKQLDADKADTSSIEAQVVPVYVNYQLSPAFNVWAEAQFDVGSDDADDIAASGLKKANFDTAEFEGWAENVYSVGARYTF